MRGEEALLVLEATAERLFLAGDDEDGLDPDLARRLREIGVELAGHVHTLHALLSSMAEPEPRR